MSKAARKTRRRNRRRDTGPVLSLSVAEYYRQMLTGAIPPVTAPTYEEYVTHALRNTI
ncbi:hypothetical protein [Mycolicibacterium smegmatis]|uniref:hypothetical protein n=1 Tax=Mycolicibacterium smegmatis TaxID=1772 RepID=UPI0013034D96|nr:hypothetical protein [Mycolicibacterium smegmatis]